MPTKDSKTPQEEKAPKARESGAEMVQRMTGYDELAIEEAFGKPFESFNSDTMAQRALIFLDLRWNHGHKNAEAKKRAMEMTFKEIGSYFDEVEDEPMPEEPVTESGKEPSAPK